jgi:hypothetical protein
MRRRDPTERLVHDGLNLRILVEYNGRDTHKRKVVKVR